MDRMGVGMLRVRPYIAGRLFSKLPASEHHPITASCRNCPVHASMRMWWRWRGRMAQPSGSPPKAFHAYARVPKFL